MKAVFRGDEKMRFSIFLRKVLAGSGDGQFTVAHVFHRQQIVGDFLHNLFFAAQKKHFKAIVFIEVYVDRRDYIVVMLVLDIVQFF